jgi:primosomal protein N' (replication factor Y)
MKGSGRYAHVIVRGMPDALTYEIPEFLTTCAIGDEVIVEIRNRLERGWITGLTDQPYTPEKEISSPPADSFQTSLFTKDEIQTKVKTKLILDNFKAFNPEDLSFLCWMADYYGAPMYEVFENAVPKRNEGRAPVFLKLDHSKISDFSSLKEELKKKAPAQAMALETLHTNENSILYSSITDASIRRACKALEKKGYVEFFELPPGAPISSDTPTPGPPLNQDQNRAVSAINDKVNASEFSTFLLYGITGSGKTEVYLETIRNALEKGGKALLIVPEIALTPQIIGRFKERLGVPIAVLHSKIGASSRWASWEHIIRDEVSLTIGARSAIFAPVKDLSLIIVDEEHEGSYKQSDGLRYHARDLAIMKAKHHACPVVLGSATPSFETLHNIQKGSYSLLELKERATRASLPEMQLVDMKSIKKSEMISENISPALYEKMKETLHNGEQIIIFYNRRGFANYLQCATCGYVLSCPYCSVTMTYYKNRDKVSCHYCGENKKAPTLCPRCHDKDTVQIDTSEGKKTPRKFGVMESKGSGTEKIYEEIASLFPETTIARLDRESVSEKDSIEKILAGMHEGKSQILIGTQMIAKGHDLPNVTLVGFINADVGLHFPDFRASERIFQLIIQAAGRAGRGTLPGKVIIQTFEPDHPTIVAAISNKFKAFARYEMEFRKNMEYPPHARLARIVTSTTNRESAHTAAYRVAEYLASIRKTENLDLGEWKLLGPSPAPIEKLRGRYRWHLLIKSKSPKTLSRIATHLNRWKFTQKDIKEFRMTVDIDPIDML